MTVNKASDWLIHNLGTVINNNKKPKLIFKPRKEMQESMEDAIAAESVSLL